MYLLGMDIGTYESKGVIVDLAGRVVCQCAVPHDLSIPQQGWAEHRAESVWWADCVTLCRDLLSDSGIAPDQIRAVGCSAIGPCVLPVDAACRPLRDGAILYGIDTRAVQEISELEDRFGPEIIFDQAGNSLSAQSAGPKILWLKNHEPAIHSQAHKFVTSTTFLVARLTGRFVIDHLTAAYFAPLYDLAHNRWDLAFCHGILAPEQLPDVAWSTEVAGHVTDEAARQTGLAPGTPVIVGTADAPAEAVSVGVTSPGQMMLMYGSTVFLIQVVANPVRDARLWAAPFLFPGTFQLAAGMSTSGALTRWFRDQLAPDLAVAEAIGGDNAYAQLTRAAVNIPPGSEGLLVLPYFSGERTPINDPRARGVFFGLTLAHTRAHLFRAVLEGIAYGIEHHFQVLESIGAAPHDVAAVGGGTRSDLWLQIVSDVSGRTQRVPAVTLGAAYGDAFLAASGIGLFDSSAKIQEWLQPGRTVVPDTTSHACYAPYMDLYLDLYRQTKDQMHRLDALAGSHA